jgi:hypothetical protein
MDGLSWSCRCCTYGEVRLNDFECLRKYRAPAPYYGDNRHYITPARYTFTGLIAARPGWEHKLRDKLGLCRAVTE